MYRSILVPLDGSNFAEHAIPYALGIARRNQARIHLVRVHVPLFSELAPDVPSTTAARWASEQREEEAAYLNGLTGTLSEAGVDVTAELMEGPVGQALERYADARDIDLIAMTTHGRGGFERAWLGSVADLLLRHVELPILLVRPSEATREVEPAADQSFRHVLVPLDESARAESILPHALHVAGTESPELVYTLLEAAWPRLGFASAYLPDTVGMYREESEERYAEASRYLAGVAERMRKDGVRVDFEVVRERPAAQAILGFADESDVDLIAMASHGRGGLSRLLLGSIADKVVRGAHVPVLVHPVRTVRQRQERPEEDTATSRNRSADRLGTAEPGLQSARSATQGA